MIHRARGLSVWALGAILAGLWPGVTAAAAGEADGALPYDLAFDLRELAWDRPAVSPGGRQVAYAVRTPVRDRSLPSRFQPDGTPTSMVGVRLWVAGVEGGEGREVCPPGADCWRPSWSPDGRLLAFYSNAGGHPQVWLHDPAAGTSRRLSEVRVKAKLWPGDEVWWSPDGRRIYLAIADPEAAAPPTPAVPEPAAAPGPTVSVLASGREVEAVPGDRTDPLARHFQRENNATLAAVEVATGALTPLVPADAAPPPSVLRLSPSGRWLSYLSVFRSREATGQGAVMDLAVVPAAGGEVRLLAEGLPLSELDYFGLNYRWHPSQDRLVYLREGGLWLVDLTGAEPSPPRRLAADLGALAATVLLYTRDGRAVVVGTSPVDDHDYTDPRPTALARVPLDGGPPAVAPVAAGWAFRGLLAADPRTLWQARPEAATALLQEAATGERAVASLAFEGGALTVLWRGRGRLSWLAAGGRHDLMVGVYEDIATPPNLARFTPDFTARRRISQVEPRLDPVATGSAEVFETLVPRHDGSLGSVRTAVLLPSGARRGDPLPGVVMVYPGADESRFADRFGGGSPATVPALVLTSRGYAVVLPHVPLGPEKAAGHPLQEMVDALLPQVYRAAELGYVDPARLAVLGQSYGGYGAAAVASRSRLFRAAVSISGLFDLGGLYGQRGEAGAFYLRWSEGGQGRMGTHPWADLRRYLDNSPYYQADKIETPLLLVHGDEDDAIGDARKMFTALERLGKTAQLAVYRGEGHVPREWSLANAADAARRIVEFLGRHLGGGDGAAEPAPSAASPQGR